MAFIPYSFKYVPPSLPFSLKNILKREYNSFVNIFVIFTILDLFRNYFLSERIYLTRLYIYMFVGAGLIWLILRTIHKKTKMFEVEGR
jgi:hypothetical protein